jgi:hypothetical protein
MSALAASCWKAVGSWPDIMTALHARWQMKPVSVTNSRFDSMYVLDMALNV